MNRFAKFAALSAVGAFALSACGGSTDGGSSSAAPTSADATSAAASGSATSSSSAGGSLELTCPSGKINGGGSSAQDIAMQSLTQAYNTACQQGGKGQVVYTKSGSGQGIKDFTAKKLDWAGSDSALKDEEAAKVKGRCGGNDAWNLPLIVGPVAFAYKLDGVDKLVLTPKVINDIFYGKITKWNDDAIKALNKDAKLPEKAISVIYRNDESGTNDNVSKYLKGASPENFTGETGKKYFGKVGQGQQGTQAVASAIKGGDGTFGFVEWKYATDSQLGVAQIDNGKGAVELTAESAGKAMEAAEITGKGNDLKLKMKYSGTEAGVYPMVLVTYEIVCSAGQEKEQAALVKDFLTYATSPDAQKGLTESGYAPLPESVLGKVKSAISALK